MSQTREERRSALDQFAQMAMPMMDTAANLPALVPGNQNLIHGAQQLAVHRDERKVLDRLKVLAAAAGENFYYRYPVKNRKKGTTDWIEGPSVKLANDVARVFGNCDVDCRVEDLGTAWMFYARFIDLETGFSLTRPFRATAMGSRLGGDDDSRRIDASFQIAASKAIRNVVVNALQTFTDFAFDEAKNSLIEKIGRNLPAWRDRAVERTGAYVDIKRVEAVVGRPVADWTAPDVARVIATMKSVTDGMATIAETFPPLGGDEQQNPLDQFASGSPHPEPDTGSTQAPPDAAAGPAGGETLSSPAVPHELYKQCIDSLLKVATDKKTPDPEDRRAALDGPVYDLWTSRLDDREFIRLAFMNAARVIDGELSSADARRLMEARVP